MSYSLSLRPRALAEIEKARDGYAQVEHGDTFRAEVEAVVDAIQAMPLRFPVVYETISVCGLLSDPTDDRPYRRPRSSAAARGSGELAAALIWLAHA
ncbi:MAG: hypothetical protein H0T89_26320 [Deltaproteobacteria bacterium]|nr:hypothetical protein [Deltaproteobacteria bacterium]